MSPTRVILVTGPPGCGKTTVLAKTVQIIEELGLRVGGIMTGEIREAGVRVGFSLTDLLTHETVVLSHIGQMEGARIGKYVVNREALDITSMNAFESAMREAEVICCDEYGPMELTSESFVEATNRVLDSEKPLIGSIHYRARHPMLERLDAIAEILEVTISNRNSLPLDIVRKLGFQKR